MKKIIFLLLLSSFSVSAEESCLDFVNKQSLDMENTKSNCLWNESHTAVAICSIKQVTKCYVIDHNNITDVSRIQSSNIGKLGIVKASEYESISTIPKEWLSTKENQYLVSFQTKAWLNGQRYTVSGPVAVINGEYRGQ